MGRRGGGGEAAIQGGVRSRGGPVVRGDAGQRFGGGQWRGGNRWSGRYDGGRHFRHAPAVAFGFAAPYVYNYGYADDDCYQWQQIRTNYGWTWARVDVCAY